MSVYGLLNYGGRFTVDGVSMMLRTNSACGTGNKVHVVVAGVQ